MATITSTTSGDYGTGATWVGGIAPVEGDKVVIASAGTALETFSTNTAGYAIGATAITLTGTVAAGSYVIGESVQFGSTDPNYYTITNWNSGTKVLTVSALIVAIPASATLVKSRGHVVTIAGTYIAGDDSTTAFTVNGTLRASRAANSSLTVKGNIFTAATSTATIDFGRKSTSDPIPSTYTASLILNYSASMADYKYGLLINDTSKFYACGATRQTNTTLTASISAGATSATVADITGWAVGGTIVLAPSANWYSIYAEKTIATITPGTGTTGTVTWTGGVSYAHGINCPVGYFSSNVTISNYNTSNFAYFATKYTSSTSNATRELDYVAFKYVDGYPGDPVNKAFISGPDDLTQSNPFLSIVNNSWYCSGNGISIFVFQANCPGVTVDNGAFFSPNNYGFSLYLGKGSSLNFSSCHFYFNNYISLASAYEQGGQSVSFTDCVWCGVNYWFLDLSTALGYTFTNCKFHSVPSSYQYITPKSASATFTGCDFGSSRLWGTPTTPGYAFYQNLSGQVSSLVCIDSYFATPSVSLFGNTANAAPTASLEIANKDADLTNQELYTYAGIMVRDNSTTNRSPSSEKFATKVANRPFTRTYSVIAPDNTARRIIGYLRYDANYTNATPPVATLSGLGITPQTYTAGSSTNTWYKFDLSATQTSGSDGNLTLTITGTSTNTTGFFWVDGIIDLPYVTRVRHYGFNFDSNIYRTADSVIQQTTEATVGAYTGISIASGTITLTSDHTIREVYDYCRWYLCQTANLAVDDFFTSTDGVTFSSTYDLELDGGDLTGSGTLNLGAGTFSRTGSESSTLPITYDSGASVFGNISITGLIANSRVRLDNTTDNVELYNAVVAGTSVSIPVTWAANKALDLRVTNVIGTTAYLPYQSAGTLTSSMAQFTVAQTLDGVYNTNAIDGSTVTEYATDYPNIQVDIDDADGATTVARLYAWFQYSTHSAQGIVYYFGGIVATDQYNYEIQTATVDLELDNVSATSIPIKISGAYLYRDDGTTVVYASSKSIQMDPGKAYTANSDSIITKLNTIIGEVL